MKMYGIIILLDSNKAQRTLSLIKRKKRLAVRQSPSVVVAGEPNVEEDSYVSVGDRSRKQARS